MYLTSEQPTSAHEALKKAGVRHGDMATVEIAVGTMALEDKGSAHLAFCSATIRQQRILKPGSPEERSQPIQGSIEFGNSHVVLDAVKGRQGILVMTCNVFTNGHVEINPLSARFTPLPDVEEYMLRSSEGQPLCEAELQPA